MSQFARKMSVAAVLSVMLASCGGGGSDAYHALGDCFELTPGVKYVRSNDNLTWIVEEIFEGKPAFGEVKLFADGVRTGVDYQNISDGFVRLLGFIEYDEDGEASYKKVFSDRAQIPVNLAQGETIEINFTDTETELTPPGTSTITDRTITLTFNGLENLTLGNRLFENVCKLTTPDSTKGHSRVVWAAKGFGVIQEEIQDERGVIVADSRVALKQILSAP